MVWRLRREYFQFLICKVFLGLGDNVFDLDHREFLLVAELPFHFAVGEALLADGDTHRRTIT